MVTRNKSIKSPSFRIAFLIDNIISFGKYQTNIWQGANEAALDDGIELVCFCGGTLDFSPVSSYEKRRNAVYKLINKNSFDGLIILTTVGSFVEIERFKSFVAGFNPIPVVSIGRPMEGIPYVVEENYSGMKNIVDHFLREHNRKRIAFIKVPDNIPENTFRFLAYKDALKENKIEYDPDLVFVGNFMPESGERAVEYFLDEKKINFDALIAENDNMALGAIAELSKRGINVPAEVIVGGYDDIEEAEVANPSLTTVKAPVKDLGYKSVELLLKILREEPNVKNIELPSRLVIRESCGCFKTTRLTKSFNPDFGKKDFSSLKDRKEDIINSIVKQFEFPIDGQFIRLGLDILFDSFVKDMKGKKSNRHFISSLSLILRQCIESGINVLLWHELVSSFRNKILNFLSERKILDTTSSFWDSAFLLIANYAYRIPKNQVIQIEKQSETLRNVSTSIMTLYDMKKLTDIIIDALDKMNVNIFFMFLYEKVAMGNRCNSIVSNKLRLIAAYTNGVKLNVENIQKKFYSRNVISDIFKIIPGLPEKNFRLLIIPLYFRNNNFGFIVYENVIDKNFVFETLATQISNVIMSSLLYKERLKTEKKLKLTLEALADLNKKLERLSFIDELTGLYNRRAFLAFAEQQRNISIRTKRNFLLFFFDMDGLKEINDRYGHKEGDIAIKCVAEILKSSFRTSDIIARIGGDEFVVIAIDTSLEHAGAMIKKLKENTKKVNEKESKPYYISLTFGVAEFDFQEGLDIQTLINEADEQLYIKKKEKKQFAIK